MTSNEDKSDIKSSNSTISNMAVRASRYLNPEKFSADPSASSAELQWNHWFHTFENFISEEVRDAEPQMKLKLLSTQTLHRLGLNYGSAGLPGTCATLSASLAVPAGKTSRYVRSQLDCRRPPLFSGPCKKPQHLICFKNWTTCMVEDIIYSAINLKYKLCDSHNVRFNLLHGSKIMVMQEINEPILQSAVSKAATLLGAYDVSVIDHLAWEHDYYGRIFSFMADAIFITTSTHWCVERFAEMSLVPVMCMRSRTHASIQALATIMAIIEHFGTMSSVNVSYIGPPHPVLNSYLLLCPMLGANIKFKCCCEKVPVSPLLLKASENLCDERDTESKPCKTIKELFHNAHVIISGPTPRKEKMDVFKICMNDICTNVSPHCYWIYFHTCPRGKEVPDELFNCSHARTFCAFNNMHYIVAALMANAIKGHQFRT